VIGVEALRSAPQMSAEAPVARRIYEAVARALAFVPSGTMSNAITARRSAPPSEPANGASLRVTASGRMVRSTTIAVDLDATVAGEQTLRSSHHVRLAPAFRSPRSLVQAADCVWRR
jgi:hypothetical protein